MAMVGEVNCDGSIVSGLGDTACALEERGGGQDENTHGSFKTSVSGTTCCRSTAGNS